MKKIIFWILLFLSFYSISFSYDIYFSDPGRLYYKNDFTNLNDRWTELLSVYNVPNFVITKDKKYLYYYKSVNANNWYWNNIVRRNLLDNSETIIVYNVESSTSNNISLSSDDQFLYYNTRELDLMRFDLINNKSSLFYPRSYSPLANWDYVYFLNINDSAHIYRKSISTWNTTKFLNLWNNNLFFYNDNVYFYNWNDYTIRYKPITDTNPNNLWTILLSNVNQFPKSNNINSNVFLYSLRTNSNQTLMFDLSKNSYSVLFNFAWFSNYYITNSIPQYCRTELLNFKNSSIFSFFPKEYIIKNNILESNNTIISPYNISWQASTWVITWVTNWRFTSPIDYEKDQWFHISSNKIIEWIEIYWLSEESNYFYIWYNSNWIIKRLYSEENDWKWRRFDLDSYANLSNYSNFIWKDLFIFFETFKTWKEFAISEIKLFEYSPQLKNVNVCYTVNLSDFWLKTDSQNNIIDDNWNKYHLENWKIIDDRWNIITEIDKIQIDWENVGLDKYKDLNWELKKEIENHLKKSELIDNEFYIQIFWEKWLILINSLLDQLIFDKEKIKENTIKNIPIPNIQKNKLNYDTTIDIKVEMPKPITIHYTPRTEPNAWELFLVTILCVFFIVFKCFFIFLYFLPLITISKFSSIIQQYILPHLWDSHYWGNWISFIAYLVYFSWLVVLFYLFFSFIFPFYSILSLIHNTSSIFLYNISLFLNWWHYFLWLLDIFFSWIYSLIVLYIIYVLSLKFARIN